MTQRAFDNHGNEVFPVTINTIVPVDHIEPASELSRAHLCDVEGIECSDSTPMFGINLGPCRAPGITHAFCVRRGLSHQIGMILSSFSEQNEPWIGKRIYEVGDNPDEVKSLFCVVVGDTGTLLTNLGLEVKS